MPAPDLSTTVWRTSSHSGSSGGDCVQLAHTPAYAAIRDSKHTTGPALILPASALAALITTHTA
jgi:hypothetical protein